MLQYASVFCWQCMFYDVTLLFKLAMLCFTIKLLLYHYFVINVVWFEV